MAEIRPIDANALKEEFCTYCKEVNPNMFECTGCCVSLRIIDEMPTISVLAVPSRCCGKTAYLQKYYPEEFSKMMKRKKRGNHK